MPGVQKRRFELTSQNWSPDKMAQPVAWKHDVDIYIPTGALTGRVLLVANNGINTATADASVKSASDFTEATAIAIAQQTKTIVVSVSNVPNQFLTYMDDGIGRREDSSVAHSWKLFMQAPEARPFMSLHVPMMEAIVKTMDLAEKELQPWKIQAFIAAGASKRAWGVWLAAIADSRIEAIAPFVIDILNMDKVLEHTKQVYGGNWPLAFGDYQREGVTAQRKTESFDKLLQIEDPLRYLDSAYAQRLAIPKYIVNASGDDFFAPDNASYYFDGLPGVKALRVAPNSNHYGILKYVETSLITLINRVQHATALPAIEMQLAKSGGEGGNASDVLQLSFSEMPVKVVQWVASNPVARDFRYACGIRYEARPIAAAQTVTVAMAAPNEGWRASFVEAQFADGFVITSPVRILPKAYPATPPLELGPVCKTTAELPLATNAPPKSNVNRP